MLKKLILAALLLPLATQVWAEDPNNPGDDNPGTTYITDDFAIGGFFETGDSCFVESDFCTETFIYPEPELLRGKKKAAEAMARAEEYAAVACIATAEAGASLGWFFEAGGDLVIARHGNHGAVHRIKLEADLATATISAAAAGAEAGAGALAYAFASAESMADACADVEVVPTDAPAYILQACARAEANANAQALAVAGSLASSESFAESGAYGAAAIYNEVWAANIEKYQTALVTGAGSFAASSAEASAEAFALAYADAYAYALAQACAGEGAQDFDICGNVNEDEAQAYALAYAYAYAEAQATALAMVEIEVGLPVLYKNENGIEDTLVFGPDALTKYDQAFMEISCTVPEDPNL